MTLGEQFAALGVGISHHFSGGVYVKETRVPAGVRLIQHVHIFDHLSFIASGSVIVRADGWVESFCGPASIEIKAGVAHEFEALTDSVVLCIHRSDITDPEKIDDALVDDSCGALGSLDGASA